MPDLDISKIMHSNAAARTKAAQIILAMARADIRMDLDNDPELFNIWVDLNLVYNQEQLQSAVARLQEWGSQPIPNFPNMEKCRIKAK